MSRQSKMRNKRRKDGKHSAGRTAPLHGKKNRIPYIANHPGRKPGKNH